MPVSDLRSALRFYGEVLGLKLLELVGAPNAEREAGFAAAEGSLTLYESEAAGVSKATLATFLVNDLDSVVAHLRAWRRHARICLERSSRKLPPQKPPTTGPPSGFPGRPPGLFS